MAGPAPEDYTRAIPLPAGQPGLEKLMRSIVPVILTLGIAALLAGDAGAGRIFGDIKLGTKPLPEGVRVRVSRPVPVESGKPDAAPAKTGAVADSTATDKFGSYKLTVKEEGKCLLTVVYEKQPIEIQVFSNKEATRYDLILEKKDGKLTLRRK